MGTGRCIPLWSLLAVAWLSPAQDGLYEGFRNPPPEARPFVRWWWNGNQVSRDEIVRELDILKAAGFGGVDINPVGMPRVNREPEKLGLTWLSPEWNEVLKFAAGQARQRGLITDLLAGTGWPFGGPFVKPDETIQRIECSVTQLQLPGRYDTVAPVPTDPHRRIFQLQLIPRNATKIEDVVDAGPALDSDGKLKFGKLKVKLRGGDYLLYAVTLQSRFREVGQSAPGGEGLVLDHYNRGVVEKYLNRISDALGPVFGGRLGDTFRSLFCDSIEIADANWTTDFAQEFEKRRGYSLEPYLGLVLLAPSEIEGTPLGDAVRRARYDFHKTQAQLMLERFYRPFHEWCRRHGAKSRLQAYGHPWLRTDLLDGYLVPDIPEGDIWLHWSGPGTIDGVRHAVWNKYASSAAHVNGHAVVSSEAMTNLDGVFQASLAELKQGADLAFAAGVNNFVFHGFNYSPLEAGFPGWIRYGTWFSERNPWWRYVRRYTDYVARVSWILQSSQPVAELAILGPTADVWSKPYGLDRELFTYTPAYQHDLWQALHQAGYSADYISPSVLLRARAEAAHLHCGRMRYRTLLVVESESMEPEAARAIARQAAGGARIVFVGRVPERAPGLRQSDAAVRAALREAFDSGHAVLVPAPDRGNLAGWIRARKTDFDCPAPVEFTPAGARLFQLHHAQDGRDIFFLANADRARELDFTAQFRIAGKTPWRWDPETGQRAAYPPAGAPGRLRIRLGPLESMLLIWEPGNGGAVTAAAVPDRAAGVAIGSTWTVKLEPVEGAGSTRALGRLVDFASDPELAGFSGLASYRTEFEWNGNPAMLLDLGQVAETSEAVLNGKPLGVRWWGRHEYSVVGALQRGRNVLEVKVSNVAFNYCRSLKQNAVCSYWVGRSGRRDPLPAGLIGPVRLVPLPE